MLWLKLTFYRNYVTTWWPTSPAPAPHVLEDMHRKLMAHAKGEAAGSPNGEASKAA
jgi:hypothetical protein